MLSSYGTMRILAGIWSRRWILLAIAICMVVTIIVIGGLLATAVGFGVGVILAILFYLGGRDTDVTAPIYLREKPDDLSPGLLRSMLLQKPAWDPSVLTSTVLHLCTEGYYTVIDDDHLRISEGTGRLSPFERKILNLLNSTAADNIVTISQLDIDHEQYDLNNIRKQWHEDVAAFNREAINSKYWNLYWQLVRWGSTVSLLVIILLYIVLGIGALIRLAWGDLSALHDPQLGGDFNPVDIVHIAQGILASAFILLGLDRSVILTYQPSYAKRAHEWFAYVRFLKDFPRMQDKTVVSISLWQDMLVYATALNLADTINEASIGLATDSMATVVSVLNGEGIAALADVMDDGSDVLLNDDDQAMLLRGGTQVAVTIGRTLLDFVKAYFDRS